MQIYKDCIFVVACLNDETIYLYLICIYRGNGYTLSTWESTLIIRNNGERKKRIVKLKHKSAIRIEKKEYISFLCTECLDWLALNCCVFRCTHKTGTKCQCR